MAKTNRETLSLETLAKIPPVLPVISDHPLDIVSAGQDKFELCYRLGPVFDIIRHKNTAMPTTIAIYGDWGVGKTSAMRWLYALIGEWNKSKENTDGTKVHTVWFYPWKYHDKEDVWRGLISEVILASINVKGADFVRVEKAAKQFGLFLGRSFLHALGTINEKAASATQKTIEEFNRVNHPEKAYLNEFESSLKEWTDETLSDNDRMVIFIDDLDRCMPEIALQVLEALKLYLNIKRLIFVVGVDREVIEPLVKKHYKELGLEDYTKSENYLAKMFQTEVTVGPSERQVTDYLDEQLDKIEYFRGQYLDATERKLFRDLINKFSNRNPREVKRLINSAVMAGAGAEMLKKAGEKKTALSFKQGLQVFFIRKIVENPKTYNMSRLVGSYKGNAFFAEWSRIVRENRDKPGFKYSFKVPEDFKKGQAGVADLEGKTQKRLDETFLSFAPEPYHELLRDSKFEQYFHLLADEDLGILMQIEFSSEIAEISQKTEPQPPKLSDEEIIREAIAILINKPTSQVRTEDLEWIKVFEMNKFGVSDISSLEELVTLHELQLRENQISNIDSLKGLINLNYLYLEENKITDIGPLAYLRNLVRLYLDKNQISDTGPLKNLTNLTELTLGGNQITNISPLKELTNLALLELNSNKITDIKSLKGLTNLMGLGLGGNQITDISPLKNLTNLTDLQLWGNKITDIGSLKNLTELTELSLNENPISDITALNDLNKLRHLNINGCRNITDKQVAELQKALPNLEIER